MLTPEQRDELARLEREYAYSAARSDIECHCKTAGKWRDRWYYPSVPTGADPCGQMNEEDRETVATAIRYLDLRGLIERSPQGWVRVREDDAA